jgi:hypothetical protein
MKKLDELSRFLGMVGRTHASFSIHKVSAKGLAHGKQGEIIVFAFCVTAQ